MFFHHTMKYFDEIDKNDDDDDDDDIRSVLQYELKIVWYRQLTSNNAHAAFHPQCAAFALSPANHHRRRIISQIYHY